MVIDVGQAMASVTPVVDGFVLRKGEECHVSIGTRLTDRNTGLAYSPLPKLIQAHARHILISPTQLRRGIELLPHQLIASKMVDDFVSLTLFMLNKLLFKASRFESPTEIYCSTR